MSSLPAVGVGRVLVVGLTGGIASGKSTVSALLARCGAVVVDADKVARSVVEPGTVGFAQVVAHFGPAALAPNGVLDRQALGSLVFANACARRALEAIVHPLVYASMVQQLAALVAAGSHRVAVLDVPLLFEGRRALALCNKTAVVWVPFAVQLGRLIARDALDPADARQRIAAQMPLDEKRRLADYCIDNSGTRASTEEQVAALWGELLSLSRCGP